MYIFYLPVYRDIHAVFHVIWQRGATPFRLTVFDSVILLSSDRQFFMSFDSVVLQTSDWQFVMWFDSLVLLSSDRQFFMSFDSVVLQTSDWQSFMSFDSVVLLTSWIVRNNFTFNLFTQNSEVLVILDYSYSWYYNIELTGALFRMLFIIFSSVNTKCLTKFWLYVTCVGTCDNVESV